MLELQKLHDTTGAELISTTRGYQIADTYHKHRIHSSAYGMWSPFSSFNDEKKLRKALKQTLKFMGHTRLGLSGYISLVNGTQACSNFRPGYACYLYRKFCEPNSTVLDTSTGYGGRLLGAVASGVVSEYIGIDPNTVTHKANLKMTDDLCLDEITEVELHNLPAEDVPASTVKDRCDFSFTSPPYFSKELYSEEGTQSYKRYSEYNSWVERFLNPMLRLTFAALKPGGISAVNVAQTINIKNKTFDLGKSTLEAGLAAGFTLSDTLYFPMSRRFSDKEVVELATEPVFIFQKA